MTSDTNPRILRRNIANQELAFAAGGKNGHLVQRMGEIQTRLAGTKQPLQNSMLRRGFHSWCEGGDSNPYPFRDWILNPARMPVPPPSRVCFCMFVQVRIYHKTLFISRPDSRIPRRCREPIRELRWEIQAASSSPGSRGSALRLRSGPGWRRPARSHPRFRSGQ